MTAQYLEPTLARLGITFSVFELLSTVKALGSDVPQADVARRLGITPPSLTEAVRSAVQQGLLVQVKLPSDARAKAVQLTPKGQDILQEVLKAVQQAERVLCTGIPAAELRVALSVIKQANRNLAVRLQQEKA